MSSIKVVHSKSLLFETTPDLRTVMTNDEDDLSY